MNLQGIKGNEGTIAKLLIILVVCIIIAVYGSKIINKLMEAFNLKDTKDDKKAKDEAKKANADHMSEKKQKDLKEAYKNEVAKGTAGTAKNEKDLMKGLTINPWNGDEWKNLMSSLPPASYSVKYKVPDEGKVLSSINDNTSGISTLLSDGPGVLAAIKKMETQAQISYMSYLSNLYKKDLFSMLNSGHSSENMNLITDYVKSLPIGIYDKNGALVK